MGKDSIRIEVVPGLEIVEKEGSFAVTADRQIRITVIGKYLQINCHGGFCVVVDLSIPPEDISDVVSCVSIDMTRLADKFRIENGEFRMSTDDDTERIISEIHLALKAGKTAIAKLKTLEMLVRLEEVSTDAGSFFPVDKRCTPKQAVVARSVHSYMMLHIEKRITVEMLAEKFEISKTQIKESFKLYFGESIFKFIRIEKMLVAANMLKNTEESVGEVAAKCGYESASKFSKAFAEIMSVNPREYKVKTRQELI